MSKPNDESKRDLLQLMLTINEEQLEPGVSKIAWIRAQLQLFCFAGTDTTASVLSMAIAILAIRPLIQEEVLKELDEVCGADGDAPPTMGQLQKLKYLEAYVKEILRMYPPAPGVERELTEPQEIDGIMVPAGVGVEIHLLGLHRRESFFSQPDEVLPERWLHDGTNPNLPTANTDAFVAFSFGFRSCIGKHFAMIEMKTVLATLLRSHRVCPLEATTVTQELPDGCYETGLLVPNEDSNVRFVSRRM